MNRIEICKLGELTDRQPKHIVIDNIDLVVILYDKNVSVLYGRCLHRGALLGDGQVEGDNLICGLHQWDYRIDTGVSEYNSDEALYKFNSIIEEDRVIIDSDEIQDYLSTHPQPFNRKEYLGPYADTHPEDTEPFTSQIKELARDGLSKIGHHGFTESMGVDRNTLPQWKDIQYLPAQLWKRPLSDDREVKTETIIGPGAKKPLKLSIPLFVSDMSFGALSREAKIALARGADLSGTGICSGEGGMLPEEQESNSRYFYELASAKFGFSFDKVKRVQAFHFKGGQGAKTGTGGHLPGIKVTKEIAKVRGLNEGEPAISPPAFNDLVTAKDFAEFSSKVREITGGIPVGFKIAASHIEKDIDFALEAGADYIILDGRGGGTGAAPSILRNNINVPTIPALARARKHLYSVGANNITLIITGGLRIAEDFVKALMLGADAIAISNSALQAIGCLGMRACHTNNCPVGIATQKENLRSRLKIERSAKQLYNFLNATTELMKVVSRACGYDDFKEFNSDNLTTYNRDLHYLTGIAYAGVTARP
jgi:glutamate synthase domain-containing protein 2/nitrite reductase/ring-hydroxylating ferredoxin subunit